MHPTEENFFKAVIVVSVLLGIVIFYFIISMIKHHRFNVLQYKIKIKAEIETLENERKRIATDIHDELGPILSAVRLQINHLTATQQLDIDIVKKSNKYIDDVLTKTREISYNLLPNTLVRKGLVAAINEFISKTTELHPLQCVFQTEGTITLSKEQEVNIYRIIQEITNNTIKHASATLLQIQLYPEKDFVVLTTQDNGVGFDIDNKMTAGKGLGLYNLQSRADVLGANLTYSSNKKIGTIYSFEIPVIPPKA